MTPPPAYMSFVPGTRSTIYLMKNLQSLQVIARTYSWRRAPTYHQCFPPSHYPFAVELGVRCHRVQLAVLYTVRLIRGGPEVEW